MSTSSSIHAIEKLDADNFHAWKFKMQMVLVDKELWDIVDGSETAPPENQADQLKAWKGKDKKALATICLSIKDSELVHVRSCVTSKDAWAKLGEVHENKGLARRLYLRRALFSAQL